MSNCSSSFVAGKRMQMIRRKKSESNSDMNPTELFIKKNAKKKFIVQGLNALSCSYK